MILYLDGNIELAGTVDIIMIARGKKLYILIIKINEIFFSFSSSSTEKVQFGLSVTSHNHRVNNHQRLQPQGWRANCDFQVVIGYHACVEYLAESMQQKLNPDCIFLSKHSVILCIIHK